jgi:hypothetical protein
MIKKIITPKSIFGEPKRLRRIIRPKRSPQIIKTPANIFEEVEAWNSKIP